MDGVCDKLRVAEVEHRGEVDRSASVCAASARERRATKEGHIEDNIDVGCADADDHTTSSKRDVPAILRDDDAISELKLLTAQAERRVVWLQQCGAGDTFDHHPLDACSTLRVGAGLGEALCKSFERLHGIALELLGKEGDSVQISNALFLDPLLELIHALIDMCTITDKEVGSIAHIDPDIVGQPLNKVGEGVLCTRVRLARGWNASTKSMDSP